MQKKNNYCRSSDKELFQQKDAPQGLIWENGYGAAQWAAGRTSYLITHQG